MPPRSAPTGSSKCVLHLGQDMSKFGPMITGSCASPSKTTLWHCGVWFLSWSFGETVNTRTARDQHVLAKEAGAGIDLHASWWGMVVAT